MSEREKEYVQITIPAGMFPQYAPDGWEKVAQEGDMLTVRKHIG